jgi:hypothetical protein
MVIGALALAGAILYHAFMAIDGMGLVSQHQIHQEAGQAWHARSRQSHATCRTRHEKCTYWASIQTMDRVPVTDQRRLVTGVVQQVVAITR